MKNKGRKLLKMWKKIPKNEFSTEKSWFWRLFFPGFGHRKGRKKKKRQDIPDANLLKTYLIFIRLLYLYLSNPMQLSKLK
ncbi:hypothetical protein [Sediminibacterium sp. TEGAF015]|uniref:hypothetical protein n=1 Tax=Sediminibacterium sp. TEGAF015 TaxID=575378 RepID=UPI00222EE5BD|nr:hypothetical protein [Sediminibacterium sp. TEGAF015]